MAAVQNHERYKLDPVGYARDVLRVQWWSKQREIAESLLKPPYKTLVLASHSVGKTHLAGGLVNWWYDTRPRNSAVLTTAPTDREVTDLTWREVRHQRGQRGGFRGTSSPELFDTGDHYAKGISPGRAESFQGRHPEHLFILLEEAAAVKPFVWKTLRTMFQPTGNHAVLAIGNPTDTTSDMYAESQSGGWTVIQMAATEHPNVIAELRGETPPYPAAVRLSQVTEQIEAWCTPIAEADRTETDVYWPPVIGCDEPDSTEQGCSVEPTGGQYYRPGPEAEARVFGRWPSSATYGVWSDWLFSAAERKLPGMAPLTYSVHEPLQIGCDVARHGDDWTAIHVRWGSCSLHHERGNGWDTVRTATRLQELARQYAALRFPEYDSNPDLQYRKQLVRRIPICVDDTGVGGGVTDFLIANEYQAVPVNAACVAQMDLLYPDVRSELWFVTAERAKRGELDISRLDAETRRRLQVQALAPEWAPDRKGRRRLEPKAKTKERCSGRSPDDVDAWNLAYYTVAAAVPTVHQPQSRPSVMNRDRGRARSRLGL